MHGSRIVPKPGKPDGQEIDAAGEARWWRAEAGGPQPRKVSTALWWGYASLNVVSWERTASGVCSKVSIPFCETAEACRTLVPLNSSEFLWAPSTSRFSEGSRSWMNSLRRGIDSPESMTRRRYRGRRRATYPMSSFCLGASRPAVCLHSCHFESR